MDAWISPIVLSWVHPLFIFSSGKRSVYFLDIGMECEVILFGTFSLCFVVDAIFFPEHSYNCSMNTKCDARVIDSISNLNNIIKKQQLQ